MGDTRKKNWEWNVGEVNTWDGAKLAVLQDIRDELKLENRLLEMIVKNGSFDGWVASEIRGLRRDVKKGKRCHKAHR